MFRLKILLLLAGVLLAVQVVPAADPPDKVIATRKVTGVYLRHDIGDYCHTDFRTQEGQEMSFWTPCAMIYFFKAFKGKPVQLTYQVVDRYIPEARRVQRIEVVVDAKAGSLSFKEWMRKNRLTEANIHQRLGPLD